MTWKSVLLVFVFSVMIVASAVPAGAGAGTGSPGYIATNDWTGFLSCGVGTPILVWSVCSMEGVDPNDDFMHGFTVQEDLRTIVVAMQWQTDSPFVSDQLQIWLEEPDAGPGDSIAHAWGSSPLEFQVDAGQHFDPVTGDWDLRFRVLPAFETGLVYQQPFTVHYHEFYGTHAPDGYSALPSA